MATHSPRIFLSAGEASGDHYGAQIIAALAPHLNSPTFTGLGGKEMEAAGQQRIVRAEDVAIMGITEILLHIPKIYRSYRRLVRSIKQHRPNVAILIDFPDVNFRLAKHLHHLGVPVLWFVSPQLWAWKRRRLRWVQQRVDKMFVIFPFEADFYRNRGVDATFVGHPLADMPLPTVTREEYAEAARALNQEQWNYADGILQSNPLPEWAHKTKEGIRYGLDTVKPWVALLPGSRSGEISANLGEMIQAACLLGPEYEFIIPVAETVSEHHLKAMQYETGSRLTEANPPRITFVRDARSALFHSRAAVVASGTATVQAALIGTPFLVVYRVSELTFRIAKMLVQYPSEIGAHKDGYGNLPIAMPNLIAGRRIIPELINKHFKAKTVAAILKDLLEEGSNLRMRQIKDLKSVRESLLLSSGDSAVQTLCHAVLRALNLPESRTDPDALHPIHW
ncbi:MAG: lipid-A-disaccharide synthase [Acidobacteria bacterium]|nr:lipid-A-disaccharide synthase [Acidobacteriota bacterium]